MNDFETLKEATAIDDHRVAVVFRNGRKGVFDCRPYFKLGYYRKLNDASFFRCVFVSCGDLAWPGDIDIGADDVWDEAQSVEVLKGNAVPVARPSDKTSTLAATTLPNGVCDVNGKPLLAEDRLLAARDRYMD